MHLRVCVSDYRFTTLLSFFPLKMWTASALFIFTTCFTVPLTRGEGPCFCGKCIFYVVIECICIRGLVLKRGSVEKESTPRESRGQLGDLPSAILCKSRRAVVKHSYTHRHTTLTLCWMAYQTYIFLFFPSSLSRPLVNPDNGTLPVSMHYNALRSTGQHLWS